ncbi:hypothetical protein UCDDS831_g06670 [Diplodia seriata]|uniref:Uncharacterized protein n=1 Tax=Diplodia seriata TaxID=420778 RepID=A0A0G2E1L1_9PEZI|nr:hypothetical protein UCDDS831_g06670 [Diplodia seriata]
MSSPGSTPRASKKKKLAACSDVSSPSASTPATNSAGTTAASPKQLELEDKIKKKQQEIDSLESELAAEKKRHSEEATEKKIKYRRYLAMSGTGDYIPLKLEYLMGVGETLRIWSDRYSLYKAIEQSTSILKRAGNNFPFHELTDAEIDALEELNGIITADRDALFNLYLARLSPLEDIGDKLDSMAKKVKKD